ncbi:MAG TPA: DUF1566 domain-containing protein [Syntrophorhabdaceae bacterium]|nr:DUF1566 domain-containing protein [Syntrophorhabdaceae bacterium]
MSLPDEVIINAATSNVAPNALAGKDRTAAIGSTVALDGSASFDSDNGPQPLSYLWSFVSVPNGSALVDASINGKNTVAADFTPDAEGIYDTKLVVSDGIAVSEEVIRITTTGLNLPPDAVAGGDLSAYLGQSVVLSGGGSGDPDNGPVPIGYSWSFVSVPAGSTLSNSALTGADTATPSFKPDFSGIYVVRLKTTDGDSATYDNVAVSVTGNSIVASAGTGGWISPAGPVAVEYGVDQTFNITPDAGYFIAGILVDGVSVGALTSYTFDNVISSHTIEVLFAGGLQTVTATTGIGGLLDPQGSVDVGYGGEQVFNAYANEGFVLSDVRVDGVSVGPVSSYTFHDVTSAHSIEAVFSIRQYSINVAAGHGGSVNPSGVLSMTYGSSQTFNIVPEEGYYIADVLVDDTSVGAISSYTLDNVNIDHTITALFAIGQHTITSSAGPNGTISPSGSIAVPTGASQTFIMTPLSGYHIADVRIDGVSIGSVSSYTFDNITVSHSIETLFEVNQYTITASAGPGGSITPSGAVVLNHGSTQVFAIAAGADYHVTDVRVDDESVGAVIAYQFANVTRNHTIAATFSSGLYSVALPRTGQTNVYAGGDDGDYQAGVEWPNPRFASSGGGTRNDNLTGLIWPVNASTPTNNGCTGGVKKWQEALDYVACLNANGYLGRSDWRLPNVNELESFTHAGSADTSVWLTSQGFTDVQTDYYWTSTVLATGTNIWAVSLNEGNAAYGSETDTAYVWPVSGTTAGTASVWATGQLQSYRPGDDFDVNAGVVLPDPRFMINSDSSLTDNLSGLVWGPDGSAPVYETCTGGTKTWQQALDYIDCLNAGNYLGHNDWRLPNRKELRSLVHYGKTNVAAWQNSKGFGGMSPDSYWSSTTYALSPDYAWTINMLYGEMAVQSKAAAGHVLPVRAGTVIVVTDTTAPVTTASPPGGTFANAQSVTLTCDDGAESGCEKIYYTLDGSAPTTSSSVYSVPVTVSTTTTIRYFSTDLAGNTEDVKSQTYTITSVNPTVTVQFRDSAGNPISGGVVQYYSGGWKFFGTTDSNGQTTLQLAKGTYTFSMTSSYGSQSKSQNISTNPTVVFQTVRVIVQLQDSTGTLVDSGTAKYYSSSAWHEIGTTSGGQVSAELLPATYTFSMTSSYGSQSKSQNISTNPTVVFQTVRVTVQLQDSTGTLVDSGTAKYYSSSAWHEIGATSGGQVSTELLPATYTFSMTSSYGSQSKSQNISTNPTVVFQTVRVTVQLQDSTGALVDSGTAKYYSSSAWHEIGTTSGGQVSAELLPATYTFSMTSSYGSQSKSQNISTNPTVVFQTVRVTVQLQDSTCALVDSGTAKYYSSSAWHEIGATSGGQVSAELLPATYTFSMTSSYGSQSKSQNISTNPTVVFQTVRVTVQLQDSTGVPMDTGTVQYYASGWRDLGITSSGTAYKELLPATYTFAMTYAYGRQEKSHNIAADPMVVFQTGVVHSDSGRCTYYYAGGWRAFTQDKQLLPRTYSFRFDDGTADTSYFVTSAGTNNIH